MLQGTWPFLKSVTKGPQETMGSVVEILRGSWHLPEGVFCYKQIMGQVPSCLEDNFNSDLIQEATKDRFFKSN